MGHYNAKFFLYATGPKRINLQGVQKMFWSPCSKIAVAIFTT